MSTYIPQAYRHNPLYDSHQMQISFLFKRLAEFMQKAQYYRIDENYADFTAQLQRAISLIQGLSAFFESELPDGMAKDWNQVFVVLLRNVNLYSVQSDDDLFNRVIRSIKMLEDLWTEQNTIHNSASIDISMQNEILHDDSAYTDAQKDGVSIDGAAHATAHKRPMENVDFSF